MFGLYIKSLSFTIPVGAVTGFVYGKKFPCFRDSPHIKTYNEKAIKYLKDGKHVPDQMVDNLEGMIYGSFAGLVWPATCFIMIKNNAEN